MPRAKSASERRIDTWPAETALDQRVETERREMALIEHDGMAQVNRTAVVRVVGEQIEQRARALTVSPIHVREACRLARALACRHLTTGR